MANKQYLRMDKLLKGITDLFAQQNQYRPYQLCPKCYGTGENVSDYKAIQCDLCNGTKIMLQGKI